MSDIKLLPCPFCGGKAEYISFTQGLFTSRFVTCTKCGIETKRNYIKGAYAVGAWNTRKPIDSIVERLQEKAAEAYKNADNEISYDYKLMDYDVAHTFDEAIDIVKEVSNG